MRLIRNLIAVAALAGAAPAVGQQAGPLLDHHQHLLSEVARKATYDWNKMWPMEAISLPSELQALLAVRENAWNDRDRLAPHYDEKAMLLGRDGWVIGRDQVSNSLATLFSRPYQIRPVAFSQSGDSASIGGYFTRGSGADTTYVGFFYLDLKRRRGDAWQIAGETIHVPGPRIEPLVEAGYLVKLMDDAGINRALVFSNAYYFARGDQELPGEHAAVRAENDWTLAQVRQYPTRLLATCSVNPLRDYAVAEMQRCHAANGFKAIKLHFDASSIDTAQPQNKRKLTLLFAAANRLRMPIIAHLQSERGYGPAQANAFLDILSATPNIDVTVAHLWGGGGYSDDASAALKIYADAVSSGDVRTRRLFFDVAQVAMASSSEQQRSEIAARMRQIGFARLLYGSDGPEWGGLPPADHWQDFKAKMPLTADEFERLRVNVAPYLR